MKAYLTIFSILILACIAVFILLENFSKSETKIKLKLQTKGKNKIENEKNYNYKQYDFNKESTKKY